MKRKKWKIANVNANVNKLAKKHNITAITVQVLINRSIPESEFPQFLYPSFSQLTSPFVLPDMEKAVCRINEAVKKKERIFIIGDYDVDGITSLAIFYEFIKDFPGIFSFSIPHRVFDGYGLNKSAIQEAKNKGASLIIAFDCGTNSLSEIKLARSLDIDVIVIDHHLYRDGQNQAFACVNPKKTSSNTPFFDLSSGALSFKLLQALKGERASIALDLVALSLVCDVVPLKGENRMLLREGIKTLRKSERIGIRALCEISRVTQENIDTYHIGYILGPRLNASGRMSRADESLEIFLSDDKEKVYHIAKKLSEYNQLRRNIESNMVKEAIERIDNNNLGDYAIVVHNDGWHPGVLGIVASRLVEKYYRPSFVISFTENVGRGSARSIPSIHLMDVLEKSSNYLCSYGGHKTAAGLHILKEDIEAFKEKINTFIKDNVNFYDFVPSLNIDAKIDFKDITIESAKELEKLRPFGEGNSEALFISTSLSKRGAAKKLKNGYSVWLTDNERTLEGIVYDKDILDIMKLEGSFDMVYSLEYNEYHNVPRLIIKDCRLA